MSDTDLDRLTEPQEGDTRCFFLDPEGGGGDFVVTLAGYNVYISLWIDGAWQPCYFASAPERIKTLAFYYMRAVEQFRPKNVPGLFLKELFEAGDWRTIILMRNHEIIDHTMLPAYKEAVAGYSVFIDTPTAGRTFTGWRS